MRRAQFVSQRLDFRKCPPQQDNCFAIRCKAPRERTAQAGPGARDNNYLTHDQFILSTLSAQAFPEFAAPGKSICHRSGDER
jgi:hypothetical protein